MSIKIWVAWKIPLFRFGEATDIIHAQMSERFYQAYKQMLDVFWKKTHLPLNEAVMEFENKLLAIYKEHQGDFLSFHSRGFQFFLDEQFAYIIPYGDWDVNIPEWFEDFHYQNQVDRPEGISQAQYQHRKEVWDRLYLLAPTNRTYVHKVMDFQEGFLVALSPYTRMWVQEQNSRATPESGECKSPNPS